MRVEMWSDLICPWCYLGSTRLHRALQQFPDADFDVVYRSYRLNPSLSREPELDMADYMTRRYHLTRERAELGHRRLEALAAREGLHYRMDLMRPVDTLDGHRVLQLARSRGVQVAVKQRFMAGVLGEGAVISDHDTLVRLAAEAGLDPDDTRKTLASDAFLADVERDEADGRRHRLQSVPFFVFGGTDRLADAASVDELARAVRRNLS
ncbi:DsbA family oxidoreductase [Pseudonocardia sp.]|uniref:DsbA family oxidoreductase n=1 Tax=Pseudonocardia sp. TaxID=60912 RepID=UPI003D0C0545